MPPSIIFILRLCRNISNINPPPMASKPPFFIIRVDLVALRAVTRNSHLSDTVLIWNEVNQKGEFKRETYDLTWEQHNLLVTKIKACSEKVAKIRESGVEETKINKTFHIFLDDPAN